MLPIPTAALAHHKAVLGKTGSGKTSTSKVLVEAAVAAGERVCILDPIKSDWWGLTSSADGKSPGLPFVILGGPRGHVPLASTAGHVVAEFVAAGKLPLCIIDMADFEPGGAQRFFIDFADTLLKRMRGVVNLVMEEAHEFAPKERAGIGNENLSVHHAKKLATAGRSKGIRLLMATQRTQSLHNALLGSCETMIAHRLTAPADQKPVMDWLKANVAKELVSEVAASLSSLNTGTAWVCSGEAQFFERVEFPRITTFDNSATPTGDLAEMEVRTAEVDVEALRVLLAPTPAPMPAGAAAPSAGATEEARQEGYHRGHATGLEEGLRRGRAAGITIGIERVQAAVRQISADAHAAIDQLDQVPAAPPLTTPPRQPQSVPRASQQDGGLCTANRKVIGVLEAVWPRSMTFNQAAKAAGVGMKSSQFGRYEPELRASGTVVLVGADRYKAMVSQPSGVNLLDSFIGNLPPKYADILRVFRDRGAMGATREELPALAGVSPTSSTTGAALKELQEQGLIERASDGVFHLTEAFR